MAKQIQDMTPVEIDTLLSEIWGRQDLAQERIARQRKLISERTEKIERVMRGERINGVNTPADGVQLHRKLVVAHEDLDFQKSELAKIKIEALPYENEYVRRGGWTRVFLAQSHDGHAHNGQNCSTCHNGESRTRFAWLINYSGKDEAEIVDDAGERACTVCYPTAPINVLKQRTKMFTPDEVEAQKAREERAIKAAAKAAEVKEKSIFTPEGTALYEDKENSWEIKSLRTAEIAATNALVDLIDVQRQSVDPEFEWLFQNGRTVEKRTLEIAEHAWCLIRSIAHKKGQTFEETFQVHEKKAQAKVRKTDREWAKNPRNR